MVKKNSKQLFCFENCKKSKTSRLLSFFSHDGSDIDPLSIQTTENNEHLAAIDFIHSLVKFQIHLNDFVSLFFFLFIKGSNP